MSRFLPFPSLGRHAFEWRAGPTLLLLAIVVTPVAAPAQGAIRAAPGERVVLEGDGVEIARFAEVSGVDAAAMKKWGDITLKRGLTSGPVLMRWHEAAGARGAASARKSGSIVVYDTQGKPVSRYSFQHAWPKTVDVGTRKVGPNQVIESVTIVAETIRRGAR